MLHLHRAERADGLVRALAELLAGPLADPFTPEVVAVPARGMERWLTQQLSASLGAGAAGGGICANIAFPSPAQLVAESVALASGIVPDADPWLPERLTWPLLEIVDASLGEPWAGDLARYLGHDDDPPAQHKQERRLGTVRHLAELLHRYALHRPELVAAWRAGQSGLDEIGGGIISSAPWQSELWRRACARIPLPDPAARLEAACARLVAEPGIVPLPARLSLFGLTRLPAGYLRVLRALAAERELHMFVLHPSPALWAEIRTILDPAGPPLRRAEDRTADRPANPLLRSWGRDARELQLVLARGGEAADHHHPLPERTPATVLERIQDDVRADRMPPGAPLAGAPDARPELAPEDRSIQVHACHGRARQVEVVREAVLHALAADPTLEPRDVIVMCPDVETFAPLIQAAFGTTEELEEAGTPALRVRLADRSLRQTNPVLGVVAELLELAGGRLTASQVLDLADREPVRRRFGLDDDDLSRMQRWVADAGIRWGLDAAHRTPFKLGRLDAGTWRSGLDRLLLGVTMSEDAQRLYGGVLPIDDVDSGAIDLAGRFAELLDRLGRALDRLAAPQPVWAWAEAIAAAADTLTAAAPRDGWQRAQLGRILDALVAEGAGTTTALALAEVRALLSGRLAGRPTRANFRTGHLTVCTLVPMRSVPHRVVCLLGLDDGAFPRKAPRDGDDVMLEAPQVGERDGRSEDRQLLLDALLAAGEQLIVTYSGNDERTNAVQPPAVPVGELLDIVDATVRTTAPAGPGAAVRRDPGVPARFRVLTRHPLQAFDPRNFESGALAAGGPWGFDAVTLGGAAALQAPRTARRPFLPSALPARVVRGYELAGLLRFVQQPVRAFLRERLSVSLYDRSDEIEDALRTELDGLERWDVGQRLLDARMAGVDGRTAGLATIARGMLPPGELGRPVLIDVYRQAEEIYATTTELVPDPRRAVDLHALLDGGRSLTGTVPGVAADTLVTSTFSRLAAKHRITAWVQLLALTVADPARPYGALTVGRGRGGAVAVQRIRPLGEDPQTRLAVATEALLALLDLYDRGMREPLPIFCKSSGAYAAAVRAEQEPEAAAREEWETRWSFEKEDREPEHVLAFGGELTLAEVMAAEPAEDEHGPGWDPSELTRFGRLACRMWDGLLDFEALS